MPVNKHVPACFIPHSGSQTWCINVKLADKPLSVFNIFFLKEQPQHVKIKGYKLTVSFTHAGLNEVKIEVYVVY